MTRRRRAWSWWAARPALSAAAIYLLLSLVFVGQGLLPGRTLSSSDFLWSATPWTQSRPADVQQLGSNFEEADAVNVFEPFMDYTKRSSGVPLWNPYIMGGRPFMADAQSALFSPFTAPVYVLPVKRALGVMALLKLFVAAFGTYLFARALGLRFGGALAAGIVFAFGTFFVVWIPWPLTNVFALLPWILLATEWVVRRPDRLSGAALAALVALQFFGGHPETSFHTLVATVVWFAFRAVQRARADGSGRRALVRPAVTFGLAVGLGTALSALLLLPLLELLFHSADLAHRKAQGPSHMDPRFIGALFLHDYWGRPTQTTIEPFVSNRGYYAGGVTLMLAAAALILRPTATRVAVALFGLLALLVAIGAQPVFGLVTKLPGFASAHNGRLVILLLFALALLAGWGLDDISSRSLAPRARRRLAVGAAVAIFLVPVAWLLVAGTLHPGQLKGALKVAWGFSDLPATLFGQRPGPTAVATIRLSALLQWLPLAGAGLLLMAIPLLNLRWRRVAVPVGAVVALTLLVLVADLFRANMGFNPAIPEANARQPVTGAIRYLQAHRPNRFAGFDSTGPINPIPPDVAMRYGLYDARGYDYPVEKRYDTWWRATAAPPELFTVPTAQAVAKPSALRGMGLLSVSDIIQDPSGPAVHLPGLKLVYSGPDARIYRNAHALPRTFLVGRQQVVDGAGAALAATRAASFDGRRVAVTEHAVPGIPTGGAEAAAGTARLVHYGSDRVVASADARRRSLLVLTDVQYPGWKATVDGRSVPIQRVDYLLRGVSVPAGRHVVRFTYAPASWRIGWIVSLLALVVLVALAGTGWRRRRAGGPPS